MLWRERLKPTQFIPTHIQGVLGRRYAKATLDNGRLLMAVQEHVGYIRGGDEPTSDISAEAQGAATMEHGVGSALDH